LFFKTLPPSLSKNSFAQRQRQKPTTKKALKTKLYKPNYLSPQHRRCPILMAVDCSSLGSKPSLKIRMASAIFWNYLGMFRKIIFLRNITLFVFQDKKLKLLASV
jgi:hypothetical protein